jgi:hypothetical protein
MATLTFAAGISSLLGSQSLAQNSGSQQTQPMPARPEREGDRARVSDSQPRSAEGQSVELTLLIAGLGRDGCDVEIKPGNRGCRFTPQTQHVGSQGKANFQFRDVELRGADHNCSFAITVREPGQVPRTIYRGFRMSSPTAPAPHKAGKPSNSFTCYMNSPSKLANLGRTDRVRQ